MMAAAGVPSTRGEAAAVVLLTGEPTASARPTNSTDRRLRDYARSKGAMDRRLFLSLGAGCARLAVNRACSFPSAHRAASAAASQRAYRRDFRGGVPQR